MDMIHSQVQRRRIRTTPTNEVLVRAARPDLELSDDALRLSFFQHDMAGQG
jgi:hypothetical protein